MSYIKLLYNTEINRPVKDNFFACFKSNTTYNIGDNLFNCNSISNTGLVGYNPTTGNFIVNVAGLYNVSFYILQDISTSSGSTSENTVKISILNNRSPSYNHLINGNLVNSQTSITHTLSPTDRTGVWNDATIFDFAGYTNSEVNPKVFSCSFDEMFNAYDTFDCIINVGSNNMSLNIVMYFELITTFM